MRRVKISGHEIAVAGVALHAGELVIALLSDCLERVQREPAALTAQRQRRIGKLDARLRMTMVVDDGPPSGSRQKGERRPPCRENNLRRVNIDSERDLPLGATIGNLDLTVPKHRTAQHLSELRAVLDHPAARYPQTQTQRSSRFRASRAPQPRAAALGSGQSQTATPA